VPRSSSSAGGSQQVTPYADASPENVAWGPAPEAAAALGVHEGAGGRRDGGRERARASAGSLCSCQGGAARGGGRRGGSGEDMQVAAGRGSAEDIARPEPCSEGPVQQRTARAKTGPCPGLRRRFAPVQSPRAPRGAVTHCGRVRVVPRAGTHSTRAGRNAAGRRPHCALRPRAMAFNIALSATSGAWGASRRATGAALLASYDDLSARDHHVAPFILQLSENTLRI
jgi:hypothetical protein